MDIKNNAQAKGTVTIKVQLSERIDAAEWRDDGLFLDWIIEHIRDYNYTEADVVSQDLELSDYTYIPEE